MALVTTVYANLRFGPGQMRRRDSGIWTVDFTPPANQVPHSIREAPDGTLFMTTINFFSYDHLWRKLPGETSWTDLGQPSSGSIGKLNNMTILSADEIWFSAHQYSARWTTSGGFTGWAMAGQLGVFRFFNGIVHAFASDHVIAIGSDNSFNNKYVGYYDGASWNLEATLAAGLYATAIHADGNDLWLGIGANSGLWHHPAKGVGAGWSLISTGAGWPAAAAITGIYGNATDLWVSLSNTSSGVDVSRSLNNGTSWTNYTRNAGNGCTSIVGDGRGNIYAGHVDASAVSIWNGASFSTEAVGGGSFGDWLYGTGSYSGHQRIAVIAETVTSKIQQEQIYGGLTTEEEFTASAPDGNNRQQFPLVRPAAANTDMPSGYLVRVFVNGLEHQYNTPAGVREFDVINDSTVEVGGLNLNDDIEIVYGGS